MNSRILISIAMVLMVSGCASTKMTVRNNQDLITPVADSTQIVFMRSSFLGGAIQSSIFDVTSGEPEFVGILSNDTKLAYEVAPGERRFMVVSEAADFMEANVTGGKTYFAMVTARMGAWKARFSMYPVRNGGPGEYQYSSDRFQGWLAQTKFAANTPESEAWFRENLSSIKQKQAKYWPVWQEKSDSDKKERTLNPEDGI